MQKKQKELFQELPVCNVLIEKPCNKRLTKRFFVWTSFLQQIRYCIIRYKVAKAFKGSATSYKIGIIDLNDTLVQLTISKSGIDDLLNDFLDEMKGLNIK